MVVVFIDTHPPLRCVVFQTAHGLQHTLHVGTACAGDRLGQQMDLKVSGLPAAVGHLMLAKHFPVLGDALAIERRVDRLEIGRGRNVPGAQMDAHLLNVGFAGGDTGDRHDRWVETGIGVGLIQVRHGVADHCRKDERGFQLSGLDHEPGEVLCPGVFQWQVVFTQLAATPLVKQVAHQPVGFVGIDVLRADHQHATAEVIEHVAAQWHRVVVRRGAGVDDVARILEALVVHRIEQQSVVTFDDRQYGLACRRGVATEEKPQVLFANQRFDMHGKQRRRGIRIAGDQFQRTAIHAPGGIDLMNCKLCAAHC